MTEIDVEIVCQTCGIWNAVGTVDADEGNLLPVVFKLVQQKILKHSEHGPGGQWQITYRPRMNPVIDERIRNIVR
jgi:hypothetical protein